MSAAFLENLARAAYREHYIGFSSAEKPATPEEADYAFDHPLLEPRTKGQWISCIRTVLNSMRHPTDDVAEAMSEHAANGVVDWRALHEAFINEALS